MVRHPPGPPDQPLTGPRRSPLSWTVIPVGPLLEAKLVGPAPAGHVRAVLAAWREVLRLEDYREWAAGGGTTRLHAAGQRGGVRVRIFASVFKEDR